MSFRRRWGTAIWHWSDECSTWPRAIDSEELDRQPRAGQLCNECRVKEPLDDTPPREAPN